LLAPYFAIEQLFTLNSSTITVLPEGGDFLYSECGQQSSQGRASGELAVVMWNFANLDLFNRQLGMGGLKCNILLGSAFSGMFVFATQTYYPLAELFIHPIFG
jgi:hypothetical protein